MITTTMTVITINIHCTVKLLLLLLLITTMMTVIIINIHCTVKLLLLLITTTMTVMHSEAAAAAAHDDDNNDNDGEGLMMTFLTTIMKVPSRTCHLQIGHSMKSGHHSLGSQSSECNGVVAAVLLCGLIQGYTSSPCL